MPDSFQSFQWGCLDFVYCRQFLLIHHTTFFARTPDLLGVMSNDNGAGECRRLPLLGLCRRWPIAWCRAATWRLPAFKSRKTMKDSLLIRRTDAPDPLRPLKTIAAQQLVSGFSCQMPSHMKWSALFGFYLGQRIIWVHRKSANLRPLASSVTSASQTWVVRPRCCAVATQATVPSVTVPR